MKPPGRAISHDSIEPAEATRLLREIAQSGHRLAADLACLARASPAGVPDYGERLRTLHREVLAFEADIATAVDRNAADQIARLPRPAGKLMLNLGSGFESLEGWVSLDAQGGDGAVNLLRPLPFERNSVDFVYLAHVLEHFYFPSEALGLLREIRRVLKSGGVLRIVVPDIRQCLLAYAAGDREFFTRRDEALFGKPRNVSLLRYFLQYAGAWHGPDGQMVAHKYAYDLETLTELLTIARFEPVPSGYMLSDFPELRVDASSRSARAEVDGRKLSLFMDAVVPDKSGGA